MFVFWGSVMCLTIVDEYPGGSLRGSVGKPKLREDRRVVKMGSTTLERRTVIQDRKNVSAVQ